MIAGAIAAGVVVTSSALMVTQQTTPSDPAPTEPSVALDPLSSFPWARAHWLILRGEAPVVLTPIAQPPAEPRVTNLPLEQYRPSGQRVYRERPGMLQPVAIVMHATGSGTAGSGFANVRALHRYFARPAARASSHFAIGRDGTIARFIDESRSSAFHVATPGWNDISIGIELLNDNAGQVYPPAQLEAARRLTQSLASRYSIPLEAVVTHASVQPVDRRDPVAFPWYAWRRTLLAP